MEQITIERFKQRIQDLLRHDPETAQKMIEEFDQAIAGSGAQPGAVLIYDEVESAIRLNDLVQSSRVGLVAIGEGMGVRSTLALSLALTSLSVDEPMFIVSEPVCKLSDMECLKRLTVSMEQPNHQNGISREPFYAALYSKKKHNHLINPGSNYRPPIDHRPQ